MSDETDDADDTADAAEPEQRSAVAPGEARKLRARRKRAESEASEFWHDVFSSEIGRREMWKFLERLHPFDARLGATPAGVPDERSTWMQLAEQLIGIEIYQQWWTLEPDLVNLMRQENDPRHRKPKD